MIDKNNILQGYKNSVVGIIPEEWDVKTFSELGSTLSTNTLSRDMMNEENGYALNIHYGDVLVKYGEILNCSKINIPWVNYEYAESNLGIQLQDGDFVISDTAEDYSVGKATELHGLFNTKVFSGLHTIAYRPNKNIFSQRFLGYYFNSSIYRKQLYPLIQGIKVCSISKSAISKTKLAIPPLAEQKKIAEILCTWDDAIEKQRKLIEKLELRKRGLMQRLLTGKTRLPGFAEPWKQVKLGEIGKISSAGVDKKVNDNELPVRLLNFVDVFYRDFIYDSEITYWVTAKPIKAEQCSVQKGDIFFTPSSEKQTDIALSAVAMDDMSRVVYSYHIVRLRPHIEMDLHYRAYAFKTDEFYKQAERICDGSGQRYVISQDGFRNMSIHLPSLPEQKAIAEVLTSADDEIATHRKKLDALRLQKRGLMQQLLTGKTRVKI